MNEGNGIAVDAAAVQGSLNRTSGTDGSDAAEASMGFVPVLRRNAAVAVDTGSGMVDITGVRPPMLSIAYGVGKFAGTFAPGQLILGDNDLIADKDTPLSVIVLKYNQYVKEAITQDGYAMGLRARLFPTKEAAKAAGLRIEWGPNSEKPEADFALDMLLLIEQPEKLESAMFGQSFGGKQYALAFASFDKTAYKSISNTYLQSVVYAMRGKKTWGGVWELKTRLQVSKKNTANKSWVPTFTLKGFLPEAMTAEIELLYGSFLTAAMAPNAG